MVRFGLVWAREVGKGICMSVDEVLITIFSKLWGFTGKGDIPAVNLFYEIDVVMAANS